MKEDPWWTLSPDSHASSPWTMVPTMEHDVNFRVLSHETLIHFYRDITDLNK